MSLCTATRHAITVSLSQPQKVGDCGKTSVTTSKEYFAELPKIELMFEMLLDGETVTLPVWQGSCVTSWWSQKCEFDLRSPPVKQVNL